ncbi:dihydroorotate dehydrogenase 2, partial [Pasteurella multocida subsp. multocida str. Anand1_buffalo]
MTALFYLMAHTKFNFSLHFYVEKRIIRQIFTVKLSREINEYVCINPQSPFSLDAEQAHDLTIKTLKTLGRSPFNPLLKTLFACPTGSPKTIMGLHFKNPIGLAAGADKNGEAI